FDQGELIHNVLLPKRYVWPDRDIPVIPILINCFAPPLPTWRRSYELGVALHKAIAGRPERIAIVASGGVSHWPPISPEDYPVDDPMHARVARFQMLGSEVFKEDPKLHMAFAEREKEMASSGRDLVNVKWDKLMLEKLAQADVEYLTHLDHDQVREIAGSGGAEMMMWVALMGAVGSVKGDIVFYEVVKEWMGGVGAISYDKALRSA
ncbi:MAG: DODA-type extradiol aromatic ring-opening family dioxygenase, partial [Isosphaeraceae bacterium]